MIFGKDIGLSHQFGESGLRARICRRAEETQYHPAPGADVQVERTAGNQRRAEPGHPVTQDDAIFGFDLICHGKLTAMAASAMRAARSGGGSGNFLGTRMTQPYAKAKGPCRPTHVVLAGDRDDRVNHLNDVFMAARRTCCRKYQETRIGRGFRAGRSCLAPGGRARKMLACGALIDSEAIARKDSLLVGELEKDIAGDAEPVSLAAA